MLSFREIYLIVLKICYVAKVYHSQNPTNHGIYRHKIGHKIGSHTHTRTDVLYAHWHAHTLMPASTGIPSSSQQMISPYVVTDIFFFFSSRHQKVAFPRGQTQ